MFVDTISITFPSRHFRSEGICSSRTLSTRLPKHKTCFDFEPALKEFVFLTYFFIGQIANLKTYTNHNSCCKIKKWVSGQTNPRDRAIRYRRSRWRLTGSSSVELFFGQHHGRRVNCLSCRKCCF